MQNFRPKKRMIRKIRAFKSVYFLLHSCIRFQHAVESLFIVQMKCKRCDLFRITAEISNANNQQNCIIHFAARGKISKTYMYAQRLQSSDGHLGNVKKAIPHLSSLSKNKSCRISYPRSEI